MYSQTWKKKQQEKKQRKKEKGPTHWARPNWPAWRWRLALGCGPWRRRRPSGCGGPRGGAAGPWARDLVSTRPAMATMALRPPAARRARLGGEGMEDPGRECRDLAVGGLKGWCG